MKITDDEVREAHALYERGWTLEQLGAEYGVAPWTLSYRMRVLRLPLRPKGPRPGTPWSDARRKAYERRWGTS